MDTRMLEVVVLDLTSALLCGVAIGNSANQLDRRATMRANRRTSAHGPMIVGVWHGPRSGLLRLPQSAVKLPQQIGDARRDCLGRLDESGQRTGDSSLSLADKLLPALSLQLFWLVSMLRRHTGQHPHRQRMKQRRIGVPPPASRSLPPARSFLFLLLCRGEPSLVAERLPKLARRRDQIVFLT
jgi:hypothetical protein